MAKSASIGDFSALHGFANGGLYSAEYSQVQKLLKLSRCNFKRKTLRQQSLPRFRGH